MKIWAHTLVKNEERYLWFAVTSVINHVDKVLLWDTGSTDNTLKIIKELKKKYPEKISFKEVGSVDINEFTFIRSEMLKETTSDWFMLVDGDEVWWEERIKETIRLVRESINLETVVSRYVNVIGDIYHYQDPAAGKYSIDGLTGNLTIRLMNRKITGINIVKPHGQQGFYDNRGKLIQERAKEKRIHLDETAFLHFTHLLRSGVYEKENDVPKRKMKYKRELGYGFPLDFYYPESFFRPRPAIVPNPWNKIEHEYLVRALVETPLRKFKRRFFSPGSGY